MKDFILAALPFVVIGICLAIICVNFKSEKKSYCSEGMALGMCFGIAAASAFHVNFALALSIGMLIGEAIGITKEKK